MKIEVINKNIAGIKSWYIVSERGRIPCYTWDEAKTIFKSEKKKKRNPVLHEYTGGILTAKGR